MITLFGPHTLEHSSTYDVDMGQIEDFVLAFKEPTNRNIQFSVFTYYQSKAYSYLEHLKKVSS